MKNVFIFCFTEGGWKEVPLTSFLHPVDLNLDLKSVFYMLLWSKTLTYNIALCCHWQLQQTVIGPAGPRLQDGSLVQAGYLFCAGC